eukprot:1149672-Pelagomonas_calceolata.AAC.4
MRARVWAAGGVEANEWQTNPNFQDNDITDEELNEERIGTLINASASVFLFVWQNQDFITMRKIPSFEMCYFITFAPQPSPAACSLAAG